MRKIYLKLLLIGIILIPFNVHALSGTISVSCTPSSARPGDTVSCTVSGTSNENVMSITAPFRIEGDASVTGFSTSSGWEGQDINNNTINVYTSDDKSGNFNIGTLTLKINNSASGTVKVIFESVTYDDQEDGSFSVSGTQGSVSITTATEPPVSTEKGLKTLRCSNGCNLSPPLADGKYGYTIILDKNTNSFALSATPKNSNDDIAYIDSDTGDQLSPANIVFKTSGDKSEMMIIIRVGSGSNQVDYSIIVSKAVSEKGLLSSLVVGGINVNLSDSQFNYPITLDSVDSYQITATVADSSKFKIESNSLSRKLSGENSYLITVKPIDNTSGYESTNYIVSVSKSGGSTKPTSTPKPSAAPSNNPNTGEGGLIAMALVLVLSLGITIYLYKRNINGYMN